MLYFVFATGRCNLRCWYCGGSFSPEVVPWEVEYRVEDLARFIEEDEEEAVVAFYGGEPLLNPGFIEEVLDKVPAKQFVIQTNGLLVKELSAKRWRMFDTVLLSIDGRPHVTDFYRGRGVYEKVVSAAHYLRGISFEGDLVARMAVSEQSNIYEEVAHLLSLGVFDHVHWQLDVVWSDRWRDFEGWLKASYLLGVEKLASLWVSKLVKGRVLGIAPFLGIYRALATGCCEKPPCGSGRSSFAVLTNGKVIACPIAVDASWAYLGDIWTAKPSLIRNAFSIGEPCTSCEEYEVCGGRCLYAYKERLWGEEGFRKICLATKHTIAQVRKHLRLINDLLESEVVERHQLLYPIYNNTIEIIP